MVQNFFDSAKCTLCNICLEICPLKIIVKDEKTGIPAVAESTIPLCIRCGHCEAVCPENAVQINHEKLVRVPDPEGPVTLTPKQIRVYCMSRRSVRVYKKESVAKAVIEQMLDIVRYAPSGVNRQPVKWTVIRDAKTVNQAANAVINWMREALEQKSPLALQYNFNRLVASWDKGNDPICRNAPHLVIACCKKEDPSAARDAAIALTHLDLIVPAFGLGACWAGYFAIAASASQELKNLMELPQDHVVSGALMIGVPKHKYMRPPKRNRASVVWR